MCVHFVDRINFFEQMDPKRRVMMATKRKTFLTELLLNVESAYFFYMDPSV